MPGVHCLRVPYARNAGHTRDTAEFCVYYDSSWQMWVASEMKRSPFLIHTKAPCGLCVPASAYGLEWSYRKEPVVGGRETALVLVSPQVQQAPIQAGARTPGKGLQLGAAPSPCPAPCLNTPPSSMLSAELPGNPLTGWEWGEKRSPRGPRRPGPSSPSLPPRCTALSPPKPASFSL